MKQVFNTKFDFYPFVAKMTVLEDSDNQFHYLYNMSLDSDLDIDPKLLESSKRTFMSDFGTSFNSIREARVNMGKSFKIQSELLRDFVAKEQEKINK